MDKLKKCKICGKTLGGPNLYCSECSDRRDAAATLIAAALAGAWRGRPTEPGHLLAGSPLLDGDIAQDAYELAEALLRERERTGTDENQG